MSKTEGMELKMLQHENKKQGFAEVYVMGCAIWYHLHNLKNLKNTHGGVLILVKLQAKVTLLKLTLLHGCFSCFLNCANGTKSRNASHMVS